VSGALRDEFERFTTASKLRVIVAPRSHLHRAHVAMYLRTGSRFESKESNGISHFLEHMIYRGTERLRTAHAVNAAFERIGGYLHAVTHADFGIFSVTLPPDSLAEACKLFGEVLTEPSFRDIEVEKGIVCEEILEDLDDEGRQVNADNISRALIYPSHPLGFTITGDRERVKSFTTDGLKAHHARHYTASSCVLVFSGPVDSATARHLAESAFSAIAPGAPVVAEPPVHAQKRPRLRIVENVSSQTDVRVCLRAVAESSPDRSAFDILMRTIDDGMSTRLYHRICDEKGLCYDVSAGYDGYEDDGVIDFAATVQHARVSRVTGEILELLAEIARDGVRDEEVELAKRRHLWDMEAMEDSAEDLASFYATGELFGRFETKQERCAAIGRVTARDVQDAARKVVVPERLNVVAVGLLEDGEDVRLQEVVKGFRAPRA
jgi:predicted Zn-dependent peptidase